MERLRVDLDSGVWADRHRDLLAAESMDYGHRLIIAGRGIWATVGTKVARSQRRVAGNPTCGHPRPVDLFVGHAVGPSRPPTAPRGLARNDAHDGDRRRRTTLQAGINNPGMFLLGNTTSIRDRQVPPICDIATLPSSSPIGRSFLRLHRNRVELHHQREHCFGAPIGPGVCGPLLNDNLAGPDDGLGAVFHQKR